MTPEARKKKNEYMKQWRKDNPEKVKDIAKRSRDKRKEKHKVLAKAWYEKNKEKSKQRSKKAYEATKNTDVVKEQRKQHRLNNAEKYKEYYKKYRLNNKDKSVAAVNKRNALKKLAIPLWANDFFIQEAYHLAKLRTKVFGFKWHVDHIVPINSKIVCGLHTHGNLQVIPAIENIKKSNKYWENMP